jgi:FkbM family methyltransferase
MKYDKYQIALRLLIHLRHKLNIVVVGANDGKNNDPIYDFAMAQSGATSILLIEPNKPLLPYLQSNYASHPSHKIANCAIGKEGTLTLYAIKQEVWDLFQPTYAKDWPSYRAATGITSAIKSHIERALTNQNLDPIRSIEILNIPAKQLKTLLDELRWPTPIDVLQIDAEGYDDEVIYNSNLSHTRPTLIYFESHNIPLDSGKILKRHLSKHRYRLFHMGGDTLAIASRINATCILLQLTMYCHSGIDRVSRVVHKLFLAKDKLLGKDGKHFH